jgi:transcriptional regulator with XRE-family HTH domain
MIDRGWSQAELARRARVTEITVSRLVRDQPVGIGQIARIAKALGHPVGRYVEVIAEGDADAPAAEPAVVT